MKSMLFIDRQHVSCMYIVWPMKTLFFPTHFDVSFTFFEMFFAWINDVMNVMNVRAIG